MVEDQELKACPQNHRPEVIARELRRFRQAIVIVLTLALSALAAMLLFGNAPRSFVDRLNLVLTPMVLASFGVLGWALWRFRKKCGTWPGPGAKRTK